MLQFNLLSPEWTGIIKQNLGYDCEQVGSVSVVTRLRTGRQENMVRFPTKIDFLVLSFRGGTQPPVQWIQGASFTEVKWYGCAVCWYWVVTVYCLQGEEAGKGDGNWILGYRVVRRSLISCHIASYQSPTKLTSTYHQYLRKAGAQPPFL